MGVSDSKRGRIELVNEQLRPLLAVALVALLVTSSVTAAVPGGAIASAAGNDGGVTSVTPTPSAAGNDGGARSPTPTRSAGNTGLGTGAGNSPPDSVVGPSRPTDPDGDGNYEDVNGDGSFDVVDSQALLAHLSSSTVRDDVASFDFTGDGRADASDVQWLYVHAIDPPSDDADGDGLSNDAEIELGTNAFAADTDDDGVDDWAETDGGDPVDTDGDGTLDARDADSDGDRIPDLREGADDTDGDGTPEYRDPDDDGDGITTRLEALHGANYTHDVDFDGTPNWRDADADDDGAPDGDEGTGDADGDGMPDYLDNDRDNDGLPDHYERNVTGTDPTNNDSASDEVAYDAADNGVIDGMEDFDEDTLGAYREYTIGTDPFDADADGDGLTDGFEHHHESFDPLDADTDDDGVEDGAGDRDADGLDNAGENEHGTLADHNDTDRDDLEDGREVDLGTDPTEPDTDGDALDDGEELALGTDPLAEDTDGDGTLDGDETFETTTSNETMNATVSMSGQGDVASGVRIDDGSTPILDTDAVDDAAVSPIVKLDSEDSFEHANVTISYDESAVDESNATLAVARYNRSHQTFDFLNTTIDSENGTATAQTPHFSRFVVFDVTNWEASYTANESDEGNESTSEPTSVDVVYVMDSSGSMGSNDPTGFRKKAAKRFTSALLDRDRGAVVDFDSSAYVSQGLTTDHDAVNDSIDSLGHSGGTDIGDGVDEANDHLRSESNESRARVQILLTDGQGSGGISEARTAASRNVTIHTIGFGNADRDKLKRIANITNGSFYYADNAGDLPNVFQRVANDTDQLTDSDGDGLSDRVESGFRTGYGALIETDPHDPDTDGDGLIDRHEIGPQKERTDVVYTGQHTFTVNVTYREIRSDPTTRDTDGDGLSDKEELDGWTAYLATSPEQGDSYEEARQDDGRDARSELTAVHASSSPRHTDTDEDGIDDFTEYRDGSGPRETDTDGDGIPDREEYRDDTDPAIHDHAAPVVHPYSVEADNVQRTSYTVKLGVSDPSGFTTVNFYKKGERQGQRTANGDIAETYSDVDLTVDRGVLDSIFAGASGFFLPTTVDVETVDVHGNEKRQAIKGPDTFGQAARTYDTMPINAGETGFVGLMSFSSGTTTVLGESVIGIVEMVTNPKQFVDQMVQLGEMILDNPAIITKLPGMMADQIRDQHETRNPFDRGDEQYTTFGGGWSLGYATGTVAPAAASGGSSVVQKGLTKSRKLQRLVDAADSATPSRVPNGVKPHVLRSAGKVDDALPDTNVRTGTLSAKLNRMPGPKQTQVTKQFDELDGDTKRYLGDTDVDNPASKSADLFRNAGPDGRRALNDLADTDREAADALLEMDDAATQRRFVKAYQQGEVDADELSTAVKRYDELDANGEEAADDLLAATGDDGAEMLAKADDDSIRKTVTDGGVDGYDKAIARLYGDENIDSATVSNVEDTVDDLNGPREKLAKDVIADTDHAGARFIAETSDDDIKAIFGQVQSTSDLDSRDVSRFIRSADGDAAAVVDEISPGEYTTLLRLSSKNQRISKNIIVDGEINGKSRFVDDDIGGDEVVRIARDFQDDEYVGPDDTPLNFEDVRVIARQPNGNGMFVTKQSVDHAIERHVMAESIDSKKRTTLFPTGNVIRNSGVDTPAKLPDEMSMSNRELRNEVKDLAYRTIRNKNSNGGSVEYSGISRNGIREVTINVDGSKVESVYPTEGTAVRRWDSDKGRWEKWTTNGWTEWENYQP